MFLSGVIKSFYITKFYQYRLKIYFKKFFNKSNCALFCFGSVARMDMGPYSDIDLIIVSDNKKKIEDFSNYLKLKFKNNRIDLLEAYNIKDLIEIAKIDGTDRQGCMLAVFVCGNNKIKESYFNNINDNLYNAKNENIREVLHTYVNLSTVSNNIGNKIVNLKFSKGFLRYFSFIFLLVKILCNDNNRVLTVVDSINYLSNKCLITKKEKIEYLNKFNQILIIRNKIQSINKNEKCELDLKFLSKRETKYINCLIDDSDDFEKNIKKLVVKIIDELIVDKQHFYCVENLLDLTGDVNPKIQDYVIANKLEECAVILAHKSTNSVFLEHLRTLYLSNWYVIYGIANNRNSYPETLFKLVCNDRFNYVLYDKFAWRNIRLYTAKNLSADNKTLLYIMNHFNSREMDIEAAKKTINDKKCSC